MFFVLVSVSRYSIPKFGSDVNFDETLCGSTVLENTPCAQSTDVFAMKPFVIALESCFTNLRTPETIMECVKFK